MPSKLKLAWIRIKKNIEEGKRSDSKWKNQSDQDKALRSVPSPKKSSDQSPQRTSSHLSKNDGAVLIRWTSLPADHKPQVHGFENEVLSLKNLLNTREHDNQFKAVGVVGTRGVGKTTLCQEYCYRHLREEQHKERGPLMFSPMVWVSMRKLSSEKGDTKSREMEVTKRILEGLMFEEERISDIADSDKSDSSYFDKLLYVLRLQLIGKQYLVVLDDVQEADLGLEKLLVPGLDTGTGRKVCLAFGLPKESGGTVIVTSRYEKTTEKMVGEGNLHRVLPLLSDPDSIWEIFQDAVNKLGGDDSKLNMKILEDKIKKSLDERQLFRKEIDVTNVLKLKVVSKCNGLPLVANLTARTMPEKVCQMDAELEEKMKAAKGKEVQNKEELQKQIETVQMEDTGNKKPVPFLDEEAMVQDDQDGARTSPKMPKGIDHEEVDGKKDEPNKTAEEAQGQEGEGGDEATSDEKKDEPKETAEKAQSQEGKGDDEATSGKKEEKETAEKAQSQEGKGDDEATLGKKEEKEAEEEVQKKEQPKETDDQKPQEVDKVDEETASQKKDGQGDDKEVEKEKIPEAMKQVQGKDHGHDGEAKSEKKEDDQEAKETEDHGVVAPEKDEEAPKKVVKDKEIASQREADTQVQAEAPKKKEAIAEKPHDQEEAKSS